MRTYPIDPAASVRKQLPEDSYLRPMAAAIGSLVYFFHDAEGALLYVGVTSRPRDRWHTHSRTARWWPLVRSVSVTEERMREYDARMTETAAINSERPIYNIAKVAPTRRDGSHTTHGVLTEPSLNTHIGKGRGREGKRKRRGNAAAIWSLGSVVTSQFQVQSVRGIGIGR